MMNHGAALVLLNSLVSRKTLANEVAKQLLHHLQIPNLVGVFVPACLDPDWFGCTGLLAHGHATDDAAVIDCRHIGADASL